MTASRLLRISSLAFVAIAVGCNARATTEGAESGPLTGSATGSNGGDADDGATGDESDGDAPRLDVATGESQGGEGGAPYECVEPGDLDPGEVLPCEQQAPPNSFVPNAEWTWKNEERPNVSTIPLVANLDDDDGDGRVGLCDVPDVVVLGYRRPENDTETIEGSLFILDGDTGRERVRFEGNFRPWITPAIGDMNGDGVPDIVAARYDAVVVLNADGTEQSVGSEPGFRVGSGSIALADVDNDGDVEIAIGPQLFDHTGKRLWAHPERQWPLNHSILPVDLDGDGDMELVTGYVAFHHTGAIYYIDTERVLPSTIKGWQYASTVNLDDDDRPELIVTHQRGISILEHDGRPIVEDLQPTGYSTDTPTNWTRPTFVHDVNGDGEPDFGHASSERVVDAELGEGVGMFGLYNRDAQLQWTTPVEDGSGASGATAFDFLGDGSAEAMFADQNRMFVFEGSDGRLLFESPRTSETLDEYPVVADVDNDGSAEILVVSDNGWFNEPNTFDEPALVMLGEAESRWIQARRIWNQHAYHVTNVTEDGQIPQVEPPNWLGLNTFRTQAQIEGARLCRPLPAG